MSPHVAEAMALDEDSAPAEILVYDAAWATGFEALGGYESLYSDCELYEKAVSQDPSGITEQNEQFDADCVDAHYFAWRFTVHLFDEGDAGYAAASRSFWNNWLKESLPNVLGEVEEVRETIVQIARDLG